MGGRLDNQGKRRFIFHVGDSIRSVPPLTKTNEFDMVRM
jgi:hypothetical protein